MLHRFFHIDLEDALCDVAADCSPGSVFELFPAAPPVYDICIFRIIEAEDVMNKKVAIGIRGQLFEDVFPFWGFESGTFFGQQFLFYVLYHRKNEFLECFWIVDARPI